MMIVAIKATIAITGVKNIETIVTDQKMEEDTEVNMAMAQIMIIAITVGEANLTAPNMIHMMIVAIKATIAITGVKNIETIVTEKKNGGRYGRKYGYGSDYDNSDYGWRSEPY